MIFFDILLNRSKYKSKYKQQSFAKYLYFLLTFSYSILFSCYDPLNPDGAEKARLLGLAYACDSLRCMLQNDYDD
jgi:hypothetical protein